jgi:hypothetical protein
VHGGNYGANYGGGSIGYRKCRDRNKNGICDKLERCGVSGKPECELDEGSGESGVTGGGVLPQEDEDEEETGGGVLPQEDEDEEETGGGVSLPQEDEDEEEDAGAVLPDEVCSSNFKLQTSKFKVQAQTQIIKRFALVSRMTKREEVSLPTATLTADLTRRPKHQNADRNGIKKY